MDIVQRGAAERLRRDHDELAWAVWHAAALPRAKKMPDLKKLQSEGSARRVPKQDWRSQEAILSNW